MKLNVKSALTALDGTPIKDGQGEVTFGRLFIDFLMGLSDRDRDLPALKKLERARLAEKLYSAEQASGEVEITVAEAAEIKALVGQLGTPIAVLNVERFIEG